LCIKTSNDLYKTLPNNFQLTTTDKTTIAEIMPLEVMPIPYVLVKLEDIETTGINSIIGKFVLISIGIDITSWQWYKKWVKQGRTSGFLYFSSTKVWRSTEFRLFPLDAKVS
jgi:hypothetical protein